MPMHLRSGTIKEGTKRLYTSPYSVFFAERVKKIKEDPENHYTGPELRSIIGEEWAALKPQQKEKYEREFDQAEKKFQDQLILHYGGTSKDIKTLKNLQEIPEIPRKPVTACLQYIADVRKEFMKDHEDLTVAQATKIIAEQYGELSNKERKKYEENYDNLLQKYREDKELWNKKYGVKAQQLDQFIEEKFKKSAQKEELEYQELGPHHRAKKVSKMKDDVSSTKSEEQPKKEKMEKKEKEKEKGKKNDTKKNQLEVEDKKDNKKKSITKK